MTNLKTQLAVLLLSTLCLLTGAYAQITPLGDSYTNTADPTTNYGAKPLLDVDGASQITYIQFNLSSIPTGASVSQATLKLYVNAVTTAGAFEVYSVNGAWTESKITYDLAPALGSVIDSNVPITTADKNQYILIPMTSTVQGWVNTPSSNDGIALVAIGSFNATFDSKENTTTSHPAELDIVFAGTLSGVTTASGSGLTGGGTSGTLNLSLLTTCASGQVLEWNGTAWACATASGTGTVTRVNSGAGLTGGPITGSGTLSLASNACTSGSALTALPFACSPFATLGVNSFTGSQTVTGSVTATSFSGSGAAVTGVNASQLGGLAPSAFAQLAAANTFTGNQTVNGNLSTTGVVTGSSYQIGSNLFDYGSYANGDAFLGFAGGPSQASGSSNTAVGYQALGEILTLGNNNVAVGYQALNGNGFTDVGIGNTAVGYQALFSPSPNGSPSYNTAIGYLALASSDAAGNGNNTAVGAFATTALINTRYYPSNATALGANAEVTIPNALVLGCVAGTNNCTTTTSVGIGTTAPVSALDVEANVNGGLGPTVTLTNNGGSGQISLDFNTYTPFSTGTYNPASRILVADNGNYSDNISFQANIPGAPNHKLQTNLMILATGQVGIGTTAPDNLLSVNGNADKPGGGSWGTFSDGRLKNLNGGYSSGLSQILRINPIRYRYKPDNALGIRDTDEHIGVVAQDVQRVIPEAVTENSKGYLLVNNDPIIWSMLNAIKEQQGEIRALKSELRATRQSLQKVQAQVAGTQPALVAAK